MASKPTPKSACQHHKHRQHKHCRVAFLRELYPPTLVPASPGLQTLSETDLAVVAYNCTAADTPQRMASPLPYPPRPLPSQILGQSGDKQPNSTIAPSQNAPDWPHDRVSAWSAFDFHSLPRRERLLEEPNPISPRTKAPFQPGGDKEVAISIFPSMKTPFEPRCDGEKPSPIAPRTKAPFEPECDGEKPTPIFPRIRAPVELERDTKKPSMISRNSKPPAEPGWHLPSFLCSQIDDLDELAAEIEALPDLSTAPGQYSTDCNPTPTQIDFQHPEYKPEGNYFLAVPPHRIPPKVELPEPKLKQIPREKGRQNCWPPEDLPPDAI